MRHPFVALAFCVGVACGGPSAPQPSADASRAGAADVIGPPRTQPGMITADAGQITPADPSRFHKEPGYSPYAGRTYPERAYFGDQHVHTSWSADAGSAGTTLGPEEAVRFARGEEIVSNTGQPVKLAAPLDWIAVTDHSDGMGTLAELRAGNPEMLRDPMLKRWHDLLAKGGDGAKTVAFEIIQAQADNKIPEIAKSPKFAKAVWDKNVAIQEKYNEPGRFTAFIGYEWTSNAGGGDNLHRNVIYRDGKSRAEQVLPFTTYQSENPEELWKWMAAWEQKTGGRLLAIPHNGNLSNGRMFALGTFAGGPMTREWAENRQRWEPLFEALQIKGQSESHPALSPADEFAVGWEIWDRGNLTMVPKKPGMLAHEYLREAYKNGLEAEAGLGANPFKFGMAAGSDTHTALTAVEENNFYGKFPSSEPRADRWDEDAIKYGDRVVKGWELSAGGYTGVWATGNTREELWDAMKRRETFATSGPRITVRLFAGYDFTRADLSRNPAVAGYAKGVPMGADLKAAPPGKAPTFLVAAMKDPVGGNLDRIQVIKGWLDKSGKPQERIYDAVWSDADRRRIVNGKLTPVGNTVDIASATWTNTIGDPELSAVWTDPDFDPAARAFYYARVLEIPTPRWTAYDAAYFKVRITDPKVPMITQERAFTSPIWYAGK
jgi:hypothetical protein